jgi:tetratricopeptide (TPR) repeat protein
VDNGAIITTAGVSAGIDGSLHTVARLLGRNVADRTARYMEYRWVPEPDLAPGYPYLNPSLDDRGRELQQAAIHMDAKDYPKAEAAYRALLEKDSKDGFAWYQLGFVMYSQKKFDDAIDASKRATEFPEVRAGALYNTACCYALKGATEEALDHLKQSIDAGFKHKEHIESDSDLESLRKDARFQKLLETLR